ncbi:hypothetical protein [Granulicella sibirica]|uniref:hypothetical protein n=1 Tax=Granulicella sibirica TaxID=2479048 RepID=UPI001008E142|nr:hypothetical protein [Granulicella sibirica]
MHDLVVVGVPLTVILAGILFGRMDIREVRGEISNLRGDMNRQHAEVMVRFGQIDGDLRQFYHLTGKLEARIDALEKRD